MEPILDLLLYVSLLSSSFAVVKLFFVVYQNNKHISYHVCIDTSVINKIERTDISASATTPLFFTYLRRKIPSRESSSEEDSALLCF